MAETVEGHDATSWRDLGGSPASIIFGADATPGKWQVNRPCGPLVEGTFTPHEDGSFSARSPTDRGVSCPERATPGPDLVGAVGLTAFVTVAETRNASARTMTFLDHDRKVIARWREDTAVRPSSAICEHALGLGATPDGSFTTLGHLRTQLTGDSLNAKADILPDVSSGQVLDYCHSRTTAGRQRYAVTRDGQKVAAPE